MYHYAYGGWGFPFFPLLWILVWVFIIYFIFGRKRWDRHHHDAQKSMSAEEVLSDRFAHGDIDEKEYEHRLEVLKRNKKQ